MAEARTPAAAPTPESRMAAGDFTAAAFILEVPTEDLAFLRIPEAAATFLQRELLQAAATAQAQLVLLGA